MKVSGGICACAQRTIDVEYVTMILSSRTNFCEGTVMDLLLGQNEDGRSRLQTSIDSLAEEVKQVKCLLVLCSTFCLSL